MINRDVVKTVCGQRSLNYLARVDNVTGLLTTKMKSTNTKYFQDYWEARNKNE